MLRGCIADIAKGFTPLLKGASYMAYEEIKQEICSKHGVSINELSRLACLKQDEKGVTEKSALELVKLDLEKKNLILNKPSQKFIDSVNAEEYLADYAKKHHPEDPNWFKNAIEKEYKGGIYGIEEEDAIRLAAMSYGWKSDRENSEGILWQELDNLSEKSLSQKIRNGRIERLTAKVNKLSTERPYPWEHKYRTKSRGVELTDGRCSIWINCYDTSMYKTDTGRLIPANPMLERIRTLESRSPLVGLTVTVTNIETWRNRKGFINLSTGPESEFLVASEDYTEMKIEVEQVGAGA